MKIYFVSLFFLLSFSSFGQKKNKIKAPEPNIVTSGFVDFQYDPSEDKIYWYVSDLEKEMLYLNSLSTGVGSNDIGLDRGKLAGEKLVKFQKAGNKLLLIQPNYQYRAVSNNPHETRAVKEAFAQSVIWGFEILNSTDGTYKIDATSFIIRDAFGVAQTLKKRGQGNYSLDLSRSALNMERTKNFPKNSEFDALVTFSGTPAGYQISTVTPSSNAISIHVHHSLIELPDDQYKKRKFDPRAGFFGISYSDYASPIGAPLQKRFIARHRLEKKDPDAELSAAIKPIIYYLDRGAPEPIRSALLEGASWWNQAFVAAGYKDAFQVKLLPEDADPMDARYNIIQWVHRSTRGWSYGGAVTDPRTGEIIKGHVTLGSLRVRQDYLIAVGLLSPYANEGDSSSLMEEMALARLRQLSAHEVGHTLGLAHSYTSSAEGRASVMDYPHPKIDIIDGDISLTDAYDDKIGSWDKVAIAYGYSEIKENEAEALEAIIQEGLKKGLTFLSDQDARPLGSAHPNAHLWDNGSSPTDQLTHLMNVRDIALQNLGENSIRKGQPYSNLEEVVVPIYFMHRYQIEAVGKLIGGVDYRYAIKGDGQFTTENVAGKLQNQALTQLLNVLSPDQLSFPPSLVEMIPPRTLDSYRNDELVQLRTGPIFDRLTPAEMVSDMVFTMIFQSERASRLVERSSIDDDFPSLEQVIEKVINQTWKQSYDNKYHQEIQHLVNLKMLDHLISLAANKSAPPQVNAISYHMIDQLKSYLMSIKDKSSSSSRAANISYGLRIIAHFHQHPSTFDHQVTKDAPDGSPIGMNGYCGY